MTDRTPRSRWVGSWSRTVANLLKDYGEICFVDVATGKVKYSREYLLDCGCHLSYDKNMFLTDPYIMYRGAEAHRCLTPVAEIANKALSYMGKSVVTGANLKNLIPDVAKVLRATEVGRSVPGFQSQVRLDFACGCEVGLDLSFSHLLSSSSVDEFARSELLAAIEGHDQQCKKHLGIDLASGPDTMSMWLAAWKPGPSDEWIKQEILNKWESPSPVFKPTAEEIRAKNQEFVLNMAAQLQEPQISYYPKNPLVKPVLKKPWMKISEFSNFGPISVFTKAELDEIRKAWRDAEEARFKFDRFQLIELD